MTSNLEAKAYARGLLGAVQHAQLDALIADLFAVSETLAEHHELNTTLRSTALPLKARQDVLDAVLGKLDTAPVVAALARVMLANDHLLLWPAVADAFKQQADLARGIHRAQVRFAQAASDEQKLAVAAALGKAIGSDVHVDAIVDESLVGGFVARVGDLVFDGSLSRQMDKLRASLLNG